jgi:hypothetical protein
LAILTSLTNLTKRFWQISQLPKSKKARKSHKALAQSHRDNGKKQTRGETDRGKKSIANGDHGEFLNWRV